jgi:hypothetical protein
VVLQIVKQIQASPWRGWAHLACARPGETLRAVAEVRDRLIGFVLCTPVQQTDDARRGRIAAVCGFLRRLVGRGRGPACVNLLDVVVCGEGSRGQAEQALLVQLDHDLRRGGGPVRVVVPETKLATQLFLRGAGYRALRVLHDYFGDEDAYLMEWQAEKPVAARAPQRQALAGVHR